MHKIRNFYNNIISPGSPFGDATIDTHAVNAAVLFPMGNNGYLVDLNFGSAGVAGGGNKGIYWLFHESLRQAAAERGILPRQMQSITWEAIRGLFPDKMKRNKDFVAKISRIWDTSPDVETARKLILEGGIAAPEWLRVDPGNNGDARRAARLPGAIDGSQADSGGNVSTGVRQGSTFSIGRTAGNRRGGESLRGDTPLPGAPIVEGATGPDPGLNAVAEQYLENLGIPIHRPTEYARIDPDRASRIGDAYEQMAHAPDDPQVREAYRELIEQTMAQYRALQEAGYQFWLFDPETDPYKGSPWAAMRDIRANKRMAVFATEAGFGSDGDFDPTSNPMLEDTGMEWPYGSPDGPLKRVFANDVFRAVHDAFGHGLEGCGFRAQGEENAWQSHVLLFHGAAVGAITTETRGQNSWLNYGPHGDHNRKAGVD
ncbi:MAG: hypothetical protein NWR51_12775, partial [Akkermansiaceae bacterium]|nr:hypothetical protein [Akkermansiaceae bacterium]